jgi:rhodanese-related sulfurtransferase
MECKFHPVRIKVIAVILLITISAIGYAFGSRSRQYKNISPQDAKRQLDSRDEIILLDVRTLEEYFESHIPNSKLIPVDMIEDEALTRLPDKHATIFVYCRSGRRSVTASVTLVKMGYTSVYNLGGIIDWPYETETGLGEGYDK